MKRLDINCRPWHACIAIIVTKWTIIASGVPVPTWYLHSARRYSRRTRPEPTPNSMLGRYMGMRSWNWHARMGFRHWTKKSVQKGILGTNHRRPGTMTWWLSFGKQLTHHHPSQTVWPGPERSKDWHEVGDTWVAACRIEVLNAEYLLAPTELLSPRRPPSITSPAMNSWHFLNIDETCYG